MNDIHKETYELSKMVPIPVAFELMKRYMDDYLKNQNEENMGKIMHIIGLIMFKFTNDKEFKELDEKIKWAKMMPSKS